MLASISSYNSFSDGRLRLTKMYIAVTTLLDLHVCLPKYLSGDIKKNSFDILCSGELTAYNTYNATGNPSEANCGTVLNEVSKRCPKASPFHVWTGFVD